MVKFPSKEWILAFKDALNVSKEYEKVAREWEGDFLFIIEPEENLRTLCPIYRQKCSAG